MTAHAVFPGFPVAIQKALSDVNFHFALGDFFAASLVASIVFTFGINIGREGEPLAVRRPDRIPSAGRDTGDLFQGAVGDINGPNLALAVACRNKRELLSVRRPAWRR